MPALRHPLLLEQYSTFAMDLIRSTDEAGDSPVDITGRKYYIVIRKSYDSEVVYSASTEGAGPHMTIPVGTDGRLVWSIPDEVLATLPAPFVGVFDIIEDIAGARERIVEGPVRITPGVTRA